MSFINLFAFLTSLLEKGLLHGKNHACFFSISLVYETKISTHKALNCLLYLCKCLGDFHKNSRKWTLNTFILNYYSYVYKMRDTCGGHKTMLWSWFFHFLFTWVLGVEFRLSGLFRPFFKFLLEKNVNSSKG